MSGNAFVRPARYAALAIVIMALGLGAAFAWRSISPVRVAAHSSLTPRQAERVSSKPPWTYGRAGTRFTLIEYADLQCPYCRGYFPVLRQWIDAHSSEVNWQWHHLPLSIHDPAATHAAVLVECAGEIGGNRAFWDTVAWVYAHTEDSGDGLPNTELPPATTSWQAIQACVKAGRIKAHVKAEVEAAAHEGITATPTLRLLDRDSGRSLTLLGPAAGDVLLSAMDLLASDTGPSANKDPHINVGAPSPNAAPPDP